MSVGINHLFEWKRPDEKQEDFAKRFEEFAQKLNEVHVQKQALIDKHARH